MESPQDRDFRIGIRRSIGAHLAVALFILIKSLVFPGTPTRYTPTLRVDIVGLPDQLKKDLAQIRGHLKPPPSVADLSKSLKETAEKAKNIKIKPLPPAPPDEMVLKPKSQTPSADKAKEKNLHKKNKSALDRIKSLERISDEPPSAEAHQTSLIKGNRVSKGTSLSADAKESAEANYYDQLRDRLQDYWALPVWVARQNLDARVRIFIDHRGRLKGFQFLKNSGNTQFDEAVKRSIQESQPFPAPPDDIASTVLSSGVIVGFPL